MLSTLIIFRFKVLLILRVFVLYYFFMFLFFNFVCSCSFSEMFFLHLSCIFLLNFIFSFLWFYILFWLLQRQNNFNLNYFSFLMFVFVRSMISFKIFFRYFIDFHSFTFSVPFLILLIFCWIIDPIPLDSSFTSALRIDKAINQGSFKHC